MKRKMATKAVGVLLTMAMMASALAGCGGAPKEAAQGKEDTSSQAQETESKTEDTAADTSGAADSGSDAGEVSGAEKYPEFLTIEVFGVQSNYQGLQSGWFGKLVKDKFNMELNIIAPNVAGGGDTLYQTRSANGNLGDLILINMDSNRLKDLVQAELVLDMTDYMDGCENLKKYLPSMEMASALAEKEGLWGIPSGVSAVPATEPGEISEPTCAVSIRWDLYKEIGYPEIHGLEDLLPIMKQMQDIAGTSNSGKDVYAFSLFKDWDGDVMQNAGSFSGLYGYDPMGTAMFNIVTGETHRVIDDDSMYVAGLRLLFEANQMGLVDPESTTQNFDTVSSKYADGAILYSLWPWLGAGYYNSQENMEAGKGFMSAAMDEAKYLCAGGTPMGNVKYGIMVGSQTKDPQRIVDFVDWLYSPEGIMASGTDTNGGCGLEGLTWELKDGKPSFTEFGRKVFIDKDEEAQVPDEWGGGTYNDGLSALNYSAAGAKDVNEENGVPYNCTLWDEYREITSTTLSKDWAEHFGTDKSPIDYFKDKDMISVIPGTSWATPEYPTDITVIKEQCRQTVVDYSWRMVFADSEEEFNSLLKEMQDIANGLGFEEVYKVDEANCAARYELFKEARGN
ncbi:MAG: ABC transporter substrate-binding protein [Lachnospiraceae bacterium]|nr:ABC transporter substrate-binding protein [Lachnospiraceae bacterium]